MSNLPAIIKRPLHRARVTWRDARVRASIAGSRVLRGVRLGAVAARLQRPEVAVLECRTGPDVSGLFSEVAAVVGFLDHYERWRRLYAGVRVDFRDGLYFEPAFGANWWEYYFEPVDAGDGRAPARIVSPHYHDLCAHRVERGMPRDTAAGIVQRHVRVKPAVQAAVDAYVRAHWDESYVVGLHYRGTDKWEDAPRVPYETAADVVVDTVRRSGRAEFRVFLATDEQPFVEYLAGRFPGKVLCRQMFRSTDGRPIDVVNADSPHQRGLDAVLDCLLLSRVHSLIRTASNLSLCSTFFNPRVPDHLLNPER